MMIRDSGLLFGPPCICFSSDRKRNVGVAILPLYYSTSYLCDSSRRYLWFCHHVVGVRLTFRLRRFLRGLRCIFAVSCGSLWLYYRREPRFELRKWKDHAVCARRYV